MLQGISLVALLACGSLAAAAPKQIDLRLRLAGSEPSAPAPEEIDRSTGPAHFERAIEMSTIKAIGGQWGRVTSTYRSPAHNRRVGGVRNSYHLVNRAIDIAPRPGVSHTQIAAAYRDAGYRLLESLDEGDHSHFAFAGGTRVPPRNAAFAPATIPVERPKWRVVMAPPAGGTASRGKWILAPPAKVAVTAGGREKTVSGAGQ